MIIVITGLDGSGTSSIGKKLHELDKGSYLFKTPDCKMFDREYIDTVIRDESVTSNMLCYLASNVYVSDYIKNNCDYKNHNVYIVRYLIDTVVSNSVAGIDMKMDYNVFGNEILKPDLTLFVSVDEKIRQERLVKRGKDVLDRVLDNEEKREMFIEKFEEHLIPKETIYVCNDKELDIVVKDVYDKIVEYKDNVIK